jgi:hypothetical protein
MEISCLKESLLRNNIKILKESDNQIEETELNIQTEKLIGE